MKLAALAVHTYNRLQNRRFKMPIRQAPIYTRENDRLTHKNPLLQFGEKNSEVCQVILTN